MYMAFLEAKLPARTPGACGGIMVPMWQNNTGITVLLCQNLLWDCPAVAQPFNAVSSLFSFLHSASSFLFSYSSLQT